MNKTIRCNPSRSTLNFKLLNNGLFPILGTCLLISACSGGGNGTETSTLQATLDDETADNLSICASRLGRNTNELFEEMRDLTGKDVFTIMTTASSVDAQNPVWDTSEADVICTQDTNDIYSFNLIDTVNDGQIVYGSSDKEFIGTIYGGTVFGFDGQDIVANLEGGTFYGGKGDDLLDSPLEHGLYTGWATVSVVSNGLNGGEFYGEEGDDFVAVLNGGEFHGEGDRDSVAILNDGIFYGGDDSDSINDPYSGNSGEMYGGEFHGDNDADFADDVYGGEVFGGSGNDLVKSLSSATFNGMTGDDTVYSLNNDAVFSGGDDDDLVDSMTGGTFDGGDGTDAVSSFADGELINVE